LELVAIFEYSIDIYYLYCYKSHHLYVRLSRS